MTTMESIQNTQKSLRYSLNENVIKNNSFLEEPTLKYSEDKYYMPAKTENGVKYVELSKMEFDIVNEIVSKTPVENRCIEPDLVFTKSQTPNVNLGEEK